MKQRVLKKLETLMKKAIALQNDMPHSSNRPWMNDVQSEIRHIINKVEDGTIQWPKKLRKK